MGRPDPPAYPPGMSPIASATPRAGNGPVGEGAISPDGTALGRRGVRLKSPRRPIPGPFSLDARDPFELLRTKESRLRTRPKQAANKGSAMPPLAEKYRPQAWADVVGQDKVVSRLKALADRGGLGGRAYWLSGQSGTGKTTLARLIGAALAEPWNVHEYDAADLTADELRTIQG